MEKIISDMSKHKQLIKQFILFVPQEEIPLKVTFRKTLIYFLLQCVGFSWVSGFLSLLKTTSFGEKEEKKKEKSVKYSLDWFLRICP